MATKAFTAQEVCSIIQAIRDSQISYLRLGSLVIRTRPHEESVQGWAGSSTAPESVIAQVKPEEIPQDTPPQGLKPEREAELDLALIEDPLAYEQAVMRGELDGKDD